MPTYEYECEKCGYTFDEFQSITAQAIKDCPKCKGSVKRLIGGGAAIIFKGSGFYKTDYRSESYKKAADSEKPKAEKPKEKKETEKPKEKKEAG